MAVNESLFPDLVRTGYQITSPPDPAYNCIAWAAGDTTAWWWPDPGNFEYWPPGVVRARTLAAFIQALLPWATPPGPDDRLEPGWAKVAIYATDERPTHAARQLSSGKWTSKLGSDDDIEHALEGLCGATYGAVVQFLQRPAAQP